MRRILLPNECCSHDVEGLCCSIFVPEPYFLKKVCRYLGPSCLRHLNNKTRDKKILRYFKDFIPTTFKASS